MINKTLKTIRKSKGLTQEQMASILGYKHKSGYCMLENGSVKMTIDKAKVLAIYLNIDPKIFFEDAKSVE